MKLSRSVQASAAGWPRVTPHCGFNLFIGRPYPSRWPPPVVWPSLESRVGLHPLGDLKANTSKFIGLSVP